VLITGAQGFVGSHFSRHLHDAGWNVAGLDLKNREDARDFFRLSHQHYDLVIHCAAVVGGRETIEGAPLALASNLELDAGLFQWARITKPGRILYFSSSAVYPVHLQAERDHASLREDMVTPERLGPLVGSPDELYGWVKLTGEILAERANRSGIETTVVRPFSGYGGDQSDSYPFPAFAARAKAREDPFIIWGAGRQVRDFIHIDDIVDASMVLASIPVTGPVNLGTGQPVSMARLAREFCRQAGYEPQFTNKPDKPSGVFWRVADVERMRNFWRPKITLEDGIRRALAR
jgi:nucleoside-diphosphate-sugar epimerase